MTKNKLGPCRSQPLIALLSVSLGALIACSDGTPELAPIPPAQAGAGVTAGAAPTAPVTGAAGQSAPAVAAPAAGSRATTAAPGASPAMGSGGSAAAPTMGAPGAAMGGAAGAPASAPGTAGPDGAGVAGAGASAEPSGAAGSAGEVPREDLGKGDGSDVIAIGDSWMNLGATGIQQSLVRLSMQPYRVYGVPGTRLLDEVIPGQYESAKRENPDIKTVVMTGGGNDILLTGAGVDRSSAGPQTMMQIDMIGERLVELWNEMGADGVKDIVYIEYSRGGSSEAAVNYATEALKPLCEAVTPARCHWIDSDLYIMMVLQDGIHPTGDGCDKIATAIIDLMEQEGMRR